MDASAHAPRYPLDRRGVPVPDGSWPSDRIAPEPLERVRRFLNIVNAEAGGDVVATVGELRGWLRKEGYVPASGFGSVELAFAHRLRDALRGLVMANTTAETALMARRELNSLARGLPVRIDFESLERTAVQRGSHPFFALLLAITHEAMRDGTWLRLKACQHCRWIVYDHSKNRSSMWCSTSACGGRTRARNYRARRRSEGVG
jgi:predicted RNA-binding Zn ribbon-like protein